jgi:hypothetical protein
MTSTAARATRATATWMLLLPPGWVSIPTDPEQARAAVRRAADTAMRGAPRDELIQVRIEIERSLLESVEQARRQGAAAVHTLVEPIRGVPVTASLIVTELSLGLGGSDGEAARELQRAFADSVGVVDNAPVSVAGLDGVRRRRRLLRPLHPDAPDVQAWETHLEYVLAVGPDDMLLLNYVTVTDEIADQLVLLFDAITETLHRRPA